MCVCVRACVHVCIVCCVLVCAVSVWVCVLCACALKYTVVFWNRSRGNTARSADSYVHTYTTCGGN